MLVSAEADTRITEVVISFLNGFSFMCQLRHRKSSLSSLNNIIMRHAQILHLCAMLDYCILLVTVLDFVLFHHLSGQAAS